MNEQTAEGVRLDRLEDDVKDIKTDVATFRDHVIRCDERQERREKAEKQEREDRKEREEKMDKRIERRWKLIVGVGVVLLGWLLGIEGREEALELLKGL